MNSIEKHGLTTGNIAMCMVAKIFLMRVFVSIDVIVSVAAKQKTWLCLCGSLGAGMLLFMMVFFDHSARFYTDSRNRLPCRRYPV